MSKFTSGEWNVTDRTFSLDGQSADWYLVYSSERTIGFIRDKADAKLIASAPEMYEMLTYFVSGKFTAEDVGSKYHWACEAGRKLLARIDGEECEE